MESQGKDHAHQLPRAPSSLSGSEVFYQGQNQSDNPSEDGKHVGTDIHQQARGNDLPTAQQSYGYGVWRGASSSKPSTWQGC